MASIISTKTSGGGGIAVTGDTSGIMQLASNDGTTAVEIDASQVFKFNSGYGSVATAYGCRAWVNFNGTGTVAIRASGNVTSITDNGTGDYTINFTTAMPDSNYSAIASISPNVGVAYSQGVAMYYSTGTGAIQAPTVNNFRIVTPANNSPFDSTYITASVFR